MDFVAGIDGGGTKTTILIGDLEGNVVDKKVLGAFNINSIGSDGFKSLIDEVIQILASYGKCLFLTIGAAGVSNIEMRSICEEKFFNAGVTFELVGDHIIALEGAHNGEEGLAVIAGTGSICFGKGKDGLIERTGGWGHIIGDEGSAYSLGRDAIKYVAKDIDGYGQQTLLKSMLAEKFGLTKREDIIKFVYSGDKATIASVAPVVSYAYSLSDCVAISIIEENATALALALFGVKKKLGLDKAYVSFFGGLIDKDTPFRSVLLNKIKTVDESIAYRDCIHDASKGALMLSVKKVKGALMIDLSHMTTETRNKNTMELSKMTSLEIISEMNREDENVPKAIHKVLPVIAEVVDWCVEALSKGGRIFYMGAGTSGRLGVLDAAECPPTFGVSPDMVVGLIAGGEKAFIKAIEGAEDSVELGEKDLRYHNLTSNDVVIGIAASGRTPYVIGGLRYANSIGCNTASISCNVGSEIGKIAKKKIEVVVGPEVLTGSTRLKAGTAQKLILNMISTASMVGIGKCYENLMVDVMQTNEKLVVRAQNILMEVTDVDRETAKRVLDEADGHVKTAIVMVLTGSNKDEANSLLNRAKGHISKALNINKQHEE